MRSYLEVFLIVFALVAVLLISTCTSSSNAQDTQCISGFIWQPVMGYTGETCDVNTRG